MIQINIFTLPLAPSLQQTEDLNHFLRSHKIIDIRKEMAIVDGNSVWTFCVSYMQESTSISPIAKNAKTDYKELLDEATFDVFSRLRKIRKSIADEEAVPAYAIFTDAELAELAKLKTLSLEAMQSIPGIGKKKIEKYANRLIKDMNGEKNEENRASDRQDS